MKTVISFFIIVVMMVTMSFSPVHYQTAGVIKVTDPLKERKELCKKTMAIIAPLITQEDIKWMDDNKAAEIPLARFIDRIENADDKAIVLKTMELSKKWERLFKYNPVPSCSGDPFCGCGMSNGAWEYVDGHYKWCYYCWICTGFGALPCKKCEDPM